VATLIVTTEVLLIINRKLIKTVFSL
jgi:hypothetical protein